MPPEWWEAPFVTDTESNAGSSAVNDSVCKTLPSVYKRNVSFFYKVSSHNNAEATSELKFWLTSLPKCRAAYSYYLCPDNYTQWATIWYNQDCCLENMPSTAAQEHSDGPTVPAASATAAAPIVPTGRYDAVTMRNLPAYMFQMNVPTTAAVDAQEFEAAKALYSAFICLGRGQQMQDAFGLAGLMGRIFNVATLTQAQNACQPLFNQVVADFTSPNQVSTPNTCIAQARNFAVYGWGELQKLDSPEAGNLEDLCRRIWGDAVWSAAVANYAQSPYAE
ncbi:hypothetical protein EJ08DRAFT_675596 [Tothia fuscella]|uniref:Uncharacterized protein n=1 Tax=Tothia fuscella TaxID=1048955 RepID=A0A9P4U2S4_9PEZI|nr:hypothetical protein EJ08DRAFT_675596 [Tothia fuscella]